MGGLDFLNTLKPQMHFISGSLDNSSTVTGVPQRMHSYVTLPPAFEAAILISVVPPTF